MRRLGPYPAARGPRGGVITWRCCATAALVSARIHQELDPASLTARIPAEAEGEQLAGRAARALGGLSRSGIAVADFALGQPTLDEVFLSLTGSRARSSVSESQETAA